MPNANADSNFRTDTCFKSQRKTLEDQTLRHYWYNLPHNNFVKRYQPLPHSSTQYTKIRTRNTNFNQPFYGNPQNKVLRRDLAEEWDVKQDCYNPYPSLSRDEMDNLPMFKLVRNASILTDPKSIANNVGNRNRTDIKISKNQYLQNKPQMKQPNGIVR